MVWHDVLSRTQTAFTQFWNSTTSTPSTIPAGRSLDLTELENRILMSATPLAPDAIVDLDQVDGDDLADMMLESAPITPDALPGDDTQLLSETDSLIATDADDTLSGSVRHELVFVDASVDDYQQLIDNLADQYDGATQLDVILIDGTSDGLDQISETLARSDQLDAIHIISHGTDGAVKLGNTWLDNSRLEAYAGDLAGWSDALTDDADILLYGCDFAATSDGQTFIDALSALTGADVAASIDKTGHESLGGDWDLEFAVGDIETATILTAADQRDWYHLLAQETIRDEFSGILYNGSDGTQDWNGWWREIGELNNARAGVVQIVDAAAGSNVPNVLQIGANDGYGIYRDFSLDGAYSATLSYDWQRDSVIGFNGSTVLVQLSTNNGWSWDTIDAIGSGQDLAPATAQFDLSSYLVDDVRLRFVTTGSGTGYAYFDNIQIQYDTTPPNAAPILDDTGAMTFDPIDEDNVDTAGNTVAEMIASAGGDPITDANPDSKEGIAVIGLNANNGTWEYDANADGNWQSVGSVSNESAILLDATSRIRFVPDADYYGTGESITFRAWDQTTGAVGDTNVDASNTGDTHAFSTQEATATIDVLPVNDAPRTVGIDDVHVQEDATRTRINLFAAFEDPEQLDQELNYSIVGVSNPTLFDKVRFNSDTGFLTLGYAADMHGEASITVRVSDAEGLSIDETFVVHVESVNDAPVGSRDVFKVHGDEVLHVGRPGILANDSDVDGDRLSVVLVQGPSHGDLKINEDGSFHYVPDPSHIGWDSFTYRASDGDAESDVVRVLIRVLVPKSPVDPNDETANEQSDDEPDLVPDSPDGPVPPLDAELPDTSQDDDENARDRNPNRHITEQMLGQEPGSQSEPVRQSQLLQSNFDSDGEGSSQRRSTTWARNAAELAVPAQFHLEIANTPNIDSGMSDFDTTAMRNDLDDLGNLLDDDGMLHQWMVGSAVGLTTGLTVGYVFWSVRAGYLLTSLIAQVPAWRIIDPLPILDSLDGTATATDSESLQSIVHSNAGNT